MPKLIIEYPDEMQAENACYYALQTVRQGRISEARGILHYCWHTVFANKVAVSTRQKKSPKSADSLVVHAKPVKESSYA